MLKHTLVEVCACPDSNTMKYRVIFRDKPLFTAFYDFNTHTHEMSPIDPAIADVCVHEPCVNELHFLGMCMSKAATIAADQCQ